MKSRKISVMAIFVSIMMGLVLLAGTITSFAGLNGATNKISASETGGGMN